MSKIEPLILTLISYAELRRDRAFAEATLRPSVTQIFSSPPPVKSPRNLKFKLNFAILQTEIHSSVGLFPDVPCPQQQSQS